MIGNIKYKFVKYFTGVLLLGLVTANAFSQMTTYINQVTISQALEVSFAKEEVNIDKGQLISNVIRIINTSEDTIKVYITLNYPPLWKTLFNPDKLYSVAGNDSIFIPVRIIPGHMMKGDTKYFINAYIEDEEHRQVTSEYFFASTEKISQWEMFAEPGSRIYLKNNENTAEFNIGLKNTGNEKQDILMTSATASSNVILMDSAGNAITDHKHDITLNQGADTTFYYKVRFAEQERNFKTLDIENYNPSTLNEEKHFSVFFQSEEPRRVQHNNMSRSAKLDFIKLTNNKEINPYGSNVLPLSAYLRVSNILEDIVFSSLHLRGQKYLNNGGNLIYNTSFYFSSMENFYGEHYARSIPWYVGYFDSKKSLQLGYVNGGAIGVQSSGKGIKGEIEFLPGNWAGAYYIKSPYFFNEDRLSSYGLHHRIELDKFSNITQYAHSHHKYAKLITDVISFAPRVRVANKHNLNFTLALSNRYSYFNPDSTFTKQGYLFGAGYSSTFFENKWRFNLRGTYTSKGFGAYGYQRYYVIHRSRLKLTPHLEMSVINNFNEYQYDQSYYTYVPGYDRNYYIFNSVNFFSDKYFRNFQPGLFYDIRYHWGYNFHLRGVNFAFNKYDITKNLQASLIANLGYARIVNDPLDDKEHFVMKLNSMIRYRNLSFTGYYNYGPLTPAMVEIKRQTNTVPQTIRGSIQHMYLFRNRHVALQSRASYLYTNISNHHSLNISPELFYFTNSGWRFSINPTYTFYTSKLQVNYYDVPVYFTDREQDFRRISNDNFQVSVGVKKDFGIPIPGTFGEYNNVDFVAYYDLNGNRIQDEGEPGIENIVIKVGDWNVITNSDGTAHFENAEPGTYEYTAFSLVNLKGWFPLVNDSLQIFKDEKVYVPFVKGVKVMGSVFLDQEEIPAMGEKNLDISGIKISAHNGSVHHTLTGPDGSFEFYLPFGEYTISLDESVLNGRFYLLKNNYKLDLSKDVENMFITFHIVEKKRRIRIKKFGGDDGE